MITADTEITQKKVKLNVTMKGPSNRLLSNCTSWSSYSCWERGRRYRGWTSPHSRGISVSVCDAITWIHHWLRIASVWHEMSLASEILRWAQVATGWHIRLCKTSRWLQNKSSALVLPGQGRPKRNLCFEVNGRFWTSGWSLCRLSLLV